MKISELIKKAQEAQEKYGDMDVNIMLNQKEECSECGQPKERSYESYEIIARAIGNGKGGKIFWIEGDVFIK